MIVILRRNSTNSTCTANIASSLFAVLPKSYLRLFAVFGPKTPNFNRPVDEGKASVVFPPLWQDHSKTDARQTQLRRSFSNLEKISPSQSDVARRRTDPSLRQIQEG